MNKDIILKAENISKQYRLGQVGTGTLSHDLNRWWHQVRGKENPYLKIGDTNDRSTKGISDYVWALQDINFEVERGEVLGIIGKNGAGKSTLLKILSKVTAPTTGTIKSRGRIASLLEVGTGFNGEMTGRENIFLNGAILGMTKKEITSKLDEIIDFSGCGRYIDTPVKRYSSGMTVRLAFAVAAFLEPEILVIDEVLAVGDAEFQKKAIGKMQDISRQGGRTVLFVSHNMAAVKSLCTRGIVLENGKVVFEGEIEECINYYTDLGVLNFINPPIHINYSNLVEIFDIVIKCHNKKLKNNDIIYLGDILSFSFKLFFKDNLKDISIALDFSDINGELISHVTNEDDGVFFTETGTDNFFDISIITDNIVLTPGMYNVSLWIGQGQITSLYRINNFLMFNVEQGNYTKRTKQIPKQTKVYLRTFWKKKTVIELI
jgi:lipopolysaccharide transport system ATP-binding protein